MEKMSRDIKTKMKPYCIDLFVDLLALIHQNVKIEFQGAIRTTSLQCFIDFLIDILGPIRCLVHFSWHFWI